ncbi:MAG TPA: hypothetical protein VFQ61_16965 [Polyangiaceae bacterium]|nr:hypothetical protein [Polyangiaceae bacterium]
MRVAASADLIDDREYAAPPELGGVPTARGTRMTVAQRVAEPELADSAAVVRHRRLAAVGWGQTAQRLVTYLERSTSWDS